MKLFESKKGPFAGYAVFIQQLGLIRILHFFGFFLHVVRNPGNEAVRKSPVRDVTWDLPKIFSTQSFLWILAGK